MSSALLIHCPFLSSLQPSEIDIITSIVWKKKLSLIRSFNYCSLHSLKKFFLVYAFYVLYTRWELGIGQGFLSIGTTDILGWIILRYGGFPVHCRMFSSIPGSPPPVVATKNVPSPCPMSHGRQNCPQLKTFSIGIQREKPRGWRQICK